MPDNNPPTSTPPLPYRPPLRPKPTYGRWLATSFRAWSRNTFSRDSLVSSFYTFLWVVPLSIGIWIYAEREELVKNTNEIKIEARPESGRVITFEGLGESATLRPESTTIRADLMGAHGKLEAVEQRLDSSQTPLQVEFGPNLTPGRHNVSIRSIANNQLFLINGVTVSKIIPEELTINVDPIVSRDQVEVQVRPELSARLDKVSFDRKVRVTGPQSYFARNPNFAVYADLQNLDKPGTVSETVTLVPSVPAPHVSIEPATVLATFAVKEVEPKKIDSMVIYVTLPPEYKYVVVPQQPSIPNVYVTGPKEILDKLDTLRPYATFDLAMSTPQVPSDPLTEDKVYTTPLRYVLPKEVHVSKADEDRTITFKIKARTPE